MFSPKVTQATCNWCGEPVQPNSGHRHDPWFCPQCESDYHNDVHRPAALFEMRSLPPAEGE